jgi:thiosulfate sulfurtransferase
MITNEQISLTISEIQEQVNKKKRIIFIDVREQWERAISHIENSIHIPLGTLSHFDLKTLNLAQYDYIVVYCQHGIRSLNAVNFFRAEHFHHAYSMQGGLENWWNFVSQ